MTGPLSTSEFDAFRLRVTLGVIIIGTADRLTLVIRIDSYR